MCAVTVTKDSKIGAAQPASVDEAGMAETISKDQPSSLDQAGDGSEVGEIS